MERYRGLYLFFTVLVTLTGVILFQALRPRSQAIILSTATPLPSPEPTPTPRPLRVYVSGSVQKPDVYTLPPESIVKDALLAAGGPATDADLDRINLALLLSDGQHVYVPRQGETDLPVSPPAAQPPPASGSKININSADATTLESLPGIGPSLAQRIVDYRQAHGPFKRIEEVENVPGIGPATFDKFRSLITTD